MPASMHAPPAEDEEGLGPIQPSVFRNLGRHPAPWLCQTQETDYRHEAPVWRSPTADATGEEMTRKKRTRSVRHCWAVVHSSVILGLVLGLPACAGIPFTEDTRPRYAADLRAEGTQSGATQASEVTSRMVSRPGTIEYAIQYANETYEAYRKKLLQESRLEQLLSGGLLTLGAAAIGAAAYGADMDVLIGLGLGGGLAHQLGTWNTNKDRLGIYVEGMKAMSCAKTAITPLRIGEEVAKDISTKADELKKAIEETANATGELTTWRASVTLLVTDTPDLLNAAEAELAEIAGVFNEANGLLSRAASTRSKVNNAGEMLETKIDEMRALIDEALNGTRADLGNLRDVIGSIGDYANIFIPGVDLGSTLQNAVGAAETGKTKIKITTHNGLLGLEKDGEFTASLAQAGLADALGRLREKRQVLLANMSAVKGLVEPISLVAVKSGLDRCGIDTSKFGSAITLDRTVVIFQPNKAGTAIVSINGGTRPYTASLIDLPAKGIGPTLPAGSNVLIIVASDETEAGATHQIKVSDSANNTVILTV